MRRPWPYKNEKIKGADGRIRQIRFWVRPFNWLARSGKLVTVRYIDMEGTTQPGCFCSWALYYESHLAGYAGNLHDGTRISNTKQLFQWLRENNVRRVGSWDESLVQTW